MDVARTAQTQPGSWGRGAQCGLLLGVGAYVLALYWPLLTAPVGFLPTSEFHDLVSLFYPAAEVTGGIVHGGDWPLWNPYMFCGTPLLASIQLGLLYPPNWLHLLIPTTRAFNLLLVGHMVFAATGTWLYCRGQSRSVAAATLASIVTGVSGRAILHLFAGHPQIVYSAAWLPLIFWLVDRCVQRPSLGRSCSLAVALALHFLVGFPMYSLLLAYLIPVYVLVRYHQASVTGNWNLWRMTGVFGGIALLGLGLVAAQILPTLEYMGQSHRGGGLTYEWASSGSFPPINLLTFFVPGCFGDHVNFPYWGETSLWESSAFCGVVTILLAVLGVSVRPDRVSLFWCGSGLVVMGIAMGQYSPLYGFCYAWVPGVDLFRGVSKLSVFVVLCLAILASRGLDMVLAGVGPIRWRARAVCAVTLLLGLAGTLAVLIETQVDAPAPLWWQSLFDWVRRPGTFTLLPITPADWPGMQSRSYEFALGKLLVSSLVLVGASAIILNARRFRRAGAFLIIALLCAELSLFAAPYLQVSDSAPYRIPARRVREAIDDEGPFRFCCVSTDETLTNQFAYEQLQGIGGVEASLLTRYTRVFRALSVNNPQSLTYLSMPVVHESLFDLLNVKYYAAAPNAPRAGDSSDDRRLVAGVFETNGTSYDLMENVDVVPRALIVHRIQEVDYEEAGSILFPRVLREGPESASFIEGRLPFELEEVSAQERATELCEVTSYGPTEMAIDVELQGNGVLLIVENDYPGWTAEVDGVGVEVLPANLVMRAIPVRSGRHTITVSYAPASVRVGLGISGAAWCLVAVLGIWSMRRPPAAGLIASVPTGAPNVKLPRRSAWAGVRDGLIGLAYFTALVTVSLLSGGWIYEALIGITLPQQSSDWSDRRVLAVIAALAIVIATGIWRFRQNRRRLLFGTAALALLLPVTLLLLEGTTRLLVPGWPAMGLHGVRPEVAFTSWGRGTSSSDAIGVNNWGQRDYPRTIEAPQGSRRLAFIGDSFLEESTSTPVSVRTEQQMARDEVEIINLGVSASSPDEYYFRIRNIALSLDVDHCFMFVYAGNDFIEAERSLESWGGIAAVYPRNSLLSALGLLGINHVLTNRRRPVLQAWLSAGDLRKQEELRFLAFAESSDETIRQLLLSAAGLPPDQTERLRTTLNGPGMEEFFQMLRSPDAGRFRSYYLTRGLWSASVGGTQWDENPVESTAFWVKQAAQLCRDRGVDFTLVIIPEAFAVDPRMVKQWSPLTDMQHMTHPCRLAAQTLREQSSAAEIDVVDLHDVFEGVRGTYLNMDGHWSDRGLELAAEALREHIAHSQK